MVKCSNFFHDTLYTVIGQLTFQTAPELDIPFEQTSLTIIAASTYHDIIKHNLAENVFFVEANKITFYSAFKIMIRSAFFLFFALSST